MFDMGKTFLSAVEREPGALAIVEGDDRMTYEAWFSEILAVAGALRELGFARGDVLATVLTNTKANATLIWASQLLGVFLVTVNWRATGEELDYAIKDSGAKGLVYEEVSRKAVFEAQGSLGLRLIRAGGTADDGADQTRDISEFKDLIAASPLREYPQAQPDDYAFMLYTSGTTGRPKGVPRKHSITRAAVRSHIYQAAFQSHETAICVMPLYHTIGIHTFLALPLVNGLAVMQPRWNPETTIDLIEAEAATSLYLVPTLFHDLLSAKNFDLAKVKTIRTLAFAGSTMAEGLTRRLTDAFRPDRFVNWYGSSEIYTFSIEPNFHLNPHSSGKPGTTSRMRIVEIGAKNVDAVVESGVEGELIADMDSDDAFDGYWNRPDANDKSLLEGWYFTGDAGFVDHDGNIRVTGRVDDIIISGGENISPGEIESVLSMHPAVDAAVAIGHPDERWGEIVVAYIKCKSSVTQEDLDEYCRNSDLANFKRPRSYVFVESYPTGATGKILRRELRSSAAEQA